MRVLRFSSGISVLLISLDFAAHLVHHIFVQSHGLFRNPAAFAGVVTVVILGSLSCIGAYLLLTGNH